MGLNIGSTAINSVKIGTTSVSAVYIGTTQVWSGSPVPSYTGFYVEDVSGSANTISLVKNNASAPTLTIETSSDGQNWSTLGQTSTTALDIQVPANGKVYVRCNTDSWGSASGFNTFFYSIYNCKVGGNIMSLLYGSNYTGNETSFPSGSTYNFRSLFNSNGWLTDVSDLILPATTLTQSCYESMFYGCGNITSAPELPATTLAQSCYKNMFYGCTSLTTAPALPATTLQASCYQGMFSGCTSLTTTPELPATTLTNTCYASIFSGCTSLTAAPELPATTLANYCYQNMFYGCTSLTSAPALNATTLAQSCYSTMFFGCTSLTSAPALNATTLAGGCYEQMFRNCSSLTSAPALNATTLAQFCYSQMFSNCTTLTTAPELPATTLANYSYQSMFNGCRSLNSIRCLATNISASGCTTNWLNGVSATGTFTKSASMSSWTTGVNGIPSGWTVVNDPSTYDYTEPFYFEDLSGNANTIYLNNTGSTPSVAWGADVYVSTDKTNWSTIGQIGVDSIEIPVTANGKTYVKVETTAYSDGTDCYFFGGADDNFAIGGNIDSLIYGMNFTGSETGFDTDYAFDRLFYGNSYLVDASKLIIPSGDTGDYMLHQMFSDCISLTDAPEWLFPTTLGDYCYSDMFNGCTSLAKSPLLPATTLANYSYYKMFKNCSAMNVIKCLATNISATGCTTEWTDGVSSTGTFTKAASMSSWTTGINGIPSGWTTVSV